MVIKLCNCAECGRDLLGDSMRAWHAGLMDAQREQYPPPVAGRMKGRPYCAACLCGPRRRAPDFAARGGPHDGEPSPSMENAVRHLEDG